MTEPHIRDQAITEASRAVPEQRGEAAKALALVYLTDVLKPLVEAATSYLRRH